MKKTMIENGNYKKDFSIPEMELVDHIINRLNIKDDEHFSYLNEQFFIYDDRTKKIFSYDFVLKENKKIIEFNGDYWHCDPKKYNKDFFNKRKQMTAEEIWNKDIFRINSIEKHGYEVLVIWESEYKNNKEETIEKCINFLKK